MKRGVLGGTFNPIHWGHLLIAEEVKALLGLDEVLFVPAGEPWMKGDEPLATKEDRWRMVTLATASNPSFVPCRIDLDRQGPSYTVDTLADLHRLVRGPCDYHFIMGVDALEGLPRWREPERLLRLCRLAVVTRPGYDARATLAAVAQALPAVRTLVDFIERTNVDISATDIRCRCREGRSIKYRVPEAVEAYIRERGLYR